MRSSSTRRLSAISAAMSLLEPTSGRSANAESTVNATVRPRVELDNGALRVVVDLAGGSICSVTAPESDVNPLSFGHPPSSAEVEPTAMGHFLCCERWGPASEAEQAEGQTWHGEASKTLWELSTGSTPEAATMSVSLSMSGLSITRHMRLLKGAPVMLVTETVTNERGQGRLYNIVQHPSIGAPFLSEGTVVDSNATEGFAQAPRVGATDSVEKPVLPPVPTFRFPTTTNPSKTATQLRTMAGAGADDVASYVLPADASHGWCTATSRLPNAAALTFGYIWPAADYPWLSLWRSNVDDGGGGGGSGGRHARYARGLEFGSSGLHQPFEVLAAVGPVMGRPVVHWLEPRASCTRQYRLRYIIRP